MKFDDLLQTRRIRREKISPEEVRHAMDRAARDLKTARMVMASDWDWGFSIAYDAVLQASRAYMFAHGFRPASAEGHKNTFAFLRVAMGARHDELIGYFDRMRNKRNQAIYDVAALITETEARSLLEKADSFVQLIRTELRDKLKS